LIAACALLPFLGKTFTIDDTLFLREAEHALVDPLHPAAFSLVWFASPERLSVTLSNGPVMAYLLAPVVAAGASESLAHLESLLFFALGIWGTAACARRLGCGPRGSALAGLLLACTPVALAMATTSMPDIPAMTFGVWGIEQYWAWIAERRTRQAVLAALLFALAMLSRLHAAGLLLIALVGGLRGVEPRGGPGCPWWRGSPLPRWSSSPRVIRRASTSGSSPPPGGSSIRSALPGMGWRSGSTGSPAFPSVSRGSPAPAGEPG
jgi:hypothetical protein